MASGPPPPPSEGPRLSPEEEVAGLSVRELLDILSLHPPVQRGTIQGRVQRRLDTLPPSRTYDRQLLKAIQRRLLDYMRINNLTTIMLNEDLEDYTAIQDTEGQVSQNPTRFHGAPSYPQQIVAGDINPIRRRVMTRTLLVDSSFRKQYVAGDGILACCGQPTCTTDPDCPCTPEPEPAPGVPSCYAATTVSNCLPPTGAWVVQEDGRYEEAAPLTNWDVWHGEPAQRYIDAYRNQFLNSQPNAGEGVVLPCRMYEDPAASFHFDLQRSTTRILSMTLTSIQLPASSVLTVPHPDPTVYLAGAGIHNLQCVYPTAEELGCISHQLDPRSTIWIVDETNGYCIHPLSIPPGHYDDTFSIAQAITTAWQRKCALDTETGDCSLMGKEGAFRADGVRAAYTYDPANQSAPHAISTAHTAGHVALSFPTLHTPAGESQPWRFSVWFVPPPMTTDGYLVVQSRGTAADDCPATESPCYEDVCPPESCFSQTAGENQTFKGVPVTGGEPRIPPVLPGRKPQVYKALPGSLGWVLGFRVAQLSSADFAVAPQPNPSFYPGGAYPTPGVPRSILIGASPYQASPPYLFLRINDHNNNYYAAVEGIAGESVMPPDTLAILELSSDPTLGVAPNASTVLNPPLEQVSNGRYILSPHIPYKREYFGAVDVSRIHAVLLDSNRNIADLGQNNYSFTLTFETLYNL